MASRKSKKENVESSHRLFSQTKEFERPGPSPEESLPAMSGLSPVSEFPLCPIERIETTFYGGARKIGDEWLTIDLGSGGFCRWRINRQDGRFLEMYTRQEKEK